MGNCLPVSRGFSPYRFICDNISELKGEFEREAASVRGDGITVVIGLQRLLTKLEVMYAVKAAFEDNGWGE